jgi:hypothetical protein
MAARATLHSLSLMEQKRMSNTEEHENTLSIVDDEAPDDETSTTEGATLEEDFDDTPAEEQEKPKRLLTMATQDIIKKSNPFVTEQVYLPRWDLWATVKALKARERDAYELNNATPAGKKRDNERANMRARLVVRCVIDPESQERIWSDKDALWLGEKSAREVDLLYKVAAKLCGLTPADEDELVKVSGSARSATAR